MPTVTVQQQPFLQTRRGTLTLLLLCAVQFLTHDLDASRHPHPGPEEPGHGGGAPRKVATKLLGRRIGQWVQRKAALPAATAGAGARR